MLAFIAAILVTKGNRKVENLTKKVRMLFVIGYRKLQRFDTVQNGGKNVTSLSS
jgi:hypothetical protein